MFVMSPYVPASLFLKGKGNKETSSDSKNNQEAEWGQAPTGRFIYVQCDGWLDGWTVQCERIYCEFWLYIADNLLVQ